jgi:hypothetical protein
VRPHIERSYALEAIGQAYDRLENGEQFGKFSITID